MKANTVLSLHFVLHLLGKPVVSAGDLDKMVNECMRDDYDDDLSDEDDPDLLVG